MSEMEKYYWLTTPYQSQTKKVTMSPENPFAEEKNLKDCVWFKESEKDDAKDFLRAYKKFIFDNYKFKQRTPWMTREWVESDENE